MINTSDDKSRAKAARETEARAKRRALQAQIVTGLQPLLEADEQLLGFARGMIAGGIRGKLTVGFEALFAPYVNVGLTERRVVLQHVQPETGKPNEILPHSFPLGDIRSVSFADIETFGAEPSARLAIRLLSDQHFRLLFRGSEPVENAKTLANVFQSLTSTRPRARTSPTQSVCPHCDQVLDRVSPFCPYCGQPLAAPQPEAFGAEPTVSSTAAESVETPEPATDDGVAEPASVAIEQTQFEATSGTKPARKARSAPTVETVDPRPPVGQPTEGHETPVAADAAAPVVEEGEHSL